MTRRALQEFAIEIPDAEADEIQTVQQGVWFRPLPLLGHVTHSFTAIDYIAKTPEGKISKPFCLNCFLLCASPTAH